MRTFRPQVRVPRNRGDLLSDLELTEEEKLLTAGYVAAARLADTCGALREFDTEIGRDPAGYLVNYLMTELWDHGFSQSEVRCAFEAALGDMGRYAAGAERRP